MNKEEIPPSNDLMKTVRESIGIRLSLLFGCFFILLIVTSIIVTGINVLPGTERDHLLWGSVVQNILAFCVPAFLLAKFCSHRPLKWLKLNNKINHRPILGVLIVYVVSMPAMDWITQWNTNLTFPESLSGLESTLRGWEDQGSSVGKLLVDSNGIISLIWGILVVGVLTGFSEELFFRGGVQGILSRTGIGFGGAVWIAAILFSAMHFQFFGFIPRLLMGVFFGYLVVWTNDLKISVFAHILNNSMVMIFGAIYGADVLTNTEITLFPEIPYLPFISFLATTVFLICCRGYFFKNNKSIELPWQKRPLLPPSEK